MAQKDKPQTQNVEGLRALYTGVLQNLHMIQYSDYAIEAKTCAVLAADLVIIVLGVDRLDGHHMLYAGFIILVVSLICAIIGLWPRTYYTAAVRVRDNPEDLEKQNRDLLLQLIIDADNVCDKTEHERQRKSRFYIWSVIFFGLGAVLSFLALYTNLKLV
ncbi:MAG TPA: hypothetical protein VNG90_01050 [Candidatus Acidoferrum sp.]|nr:hypothetical protein [Candidatus Acidoferrum sp.]